MMKRIARFLLLGLLLASPASAQLPGMQAYPLLNTACPAGTKVVFLTSGTSYTVDNCWNSLNNSVQLLGGGGGGETSTVARVSAGAASGGVGSSRVDLQACKLEYSIVSPK